MTWFWCLDHKRVEEGIGCGSTTRIGPYATQSEAATALERTRAREKAQEERDKADEKFWGRKPRF
jgi:hypothetical protein